MATVHSGGPESHPAGRPAPKLKPKWDYICGTLKSFHRTWRVFLPRRLTSPQMRISPWYQFKHDHSGLRALSQSDRPESVGRGQGSGPGRRLHWLQWPRGHGPGPGQDRSRAAALMAADRWKRAKMLAHYTERQAAYQGTMARYYQEREK